MAHCQGSQLEEGSHRGIQVEEHHGRQESQGHQEHRESQGSQGGHQLQLRQQVQPEMAVQHHVLRASQLQGPRSGTKEYRPVCSFRVWHWGRPEEVTRQKAK
jgi:hypothetical protein